MAQLNTNLLALRVCELDDLAEWALLLLVPETQAFGSDTALGHDTSCFHDR